MSLFRKSVKPQSSRAQIRIKGVRAGVLLLPNDEYRLVLECSSINFELMSEDEQDAVIDTYQSFLNSLNTNLQIVVRIRELDLSKYLEGFKQRTSLETSTKYRTQAADYTEFVSSLVTTNKILTRKFYVVLPYRATDKNQDFRSIASQLKQSADIITKGLARLDMHTKQLNNHQLLDLFYSFYCPTQAKHQPLQSKTIDQLERTI